MQAFQDAPETGEDDGLALRFLPDGGVLIDIGAGTGNYALRAALKASSVIAVEPDPALAATLRDSAFIKALRNVRVVEIAAWDGACPVRLDAGRVTPDAAGTVWAARLDDALNQYPLRPGRIDLVIIDVPGGAALRALDGMRGLVARHRPVLAGPGYWDYELRGLLYDLGYVLDDGGPGWVARPA